MDLFLGGPIRTTYFSTNTEEGEKYGQQILGQNMCDPKKYFVLDLFIDTKLVLKKKLCNFFGANIFWGKIVWDKQFIQKFNTYSVDHEHSSP